MLVENYHQFPSSLNFGSSTQFFAPARGQLHSGVCETRQDAGLPVIHSAISDSGRLRTRGGQLPQAGPTAETHTPPVPTTITPVRARFRQVAPRSPVDWAAARGLSQRPAHSVSIFRLLLKIAVGLPRSCDS